MEFYYSFSRHIDFILLSCRALLPEVTYFGTLVRYIVSLPELYIY